MINYIEKGEGLHKAIYEAGHTLVQRDGAWVASDEAAVQAIIDSFDPMPDAIAESVGQLGEHANKLIEARIHPLKAKRLQAAGLDAVIKKGKGALNAAEQAKLDTYEAAMTYPNTIFDVYDAEVARMMAATTLNEIRLSDAIAALDAVT